MIKVAISLKNTSQVINHEAKNTYEKGSFFCVYTTDGTVYKYLTSEIWRVSESYGDSGRAVLLTE